MTDTVDKATRSRIMSRVRGKNSAPEMVLRKALFARGFRYRLHVRGLPGKPDLVLQKHKAIIFINGCFWHWHGCRRSRLPSDNASYWQAKIKRNQERDRANYAALLADGWRILIMWECALDVKMRDEATRRVESWLMKPKSATKCCQIEPAASDGTPHRRLCVSALQAQP